MMDQRRGYMREIGSEISAATGADYDLRCFLATTMAEMTRSQLRSNCAQNSGAKTPKATPFFQKAWIFCRTASSDFVGSTDNASDRSAAEYVETSMESLVSDLLVR